MIHAGSTFLTANAQLARAPIYRLQIAGYGRIFVLLPKDGDTLLESPASGEYNWIDSIDDLTISVDDLEGGANLGTLSVTVSDIDGKITADLPGSLLEGKIATLTTGFPGMSRSDYATLFVGVVDTIANANDNLSYVFNCVDSSQVLSKVIYSVGDSGRATDSDNPRTLNGHPIDILIAALITEVGLGDSQVNLSKLYGYRDGTYAGMQFTFRIDTPPAAKDFIENELLKPLGGYLWVNSFGQFDVNFFYPTSIIPIFAGSLIGAWADGTGALVTSPFLIGNGVTIRVPAGTTQLQMGANDDLYVDNIGGWQVSVNGAAAVTVTGTAKPYSVSGGLNAAYPFNDAGTTSPVVVAVTAGTIITIEWISNTVSIGSGFGFMDGFGVVGLTSAPDSPGIHASSQVVFRQSVMNLTVANTVDIPLAEQADLVNVVLFKFDKDSQGTFFAQALEEYNRSIARFGQVGAGQQYGQQVIESSGMRSALQGNFIADFISRLIFLRYGLKNLQYSDVAHLWTTCVLEPGDIVSVTNKFVPDRQAGTLGITNKLMEVMDRDWNFQEGTATFKLLDAGYLSSFGITLITRNTMPDFTASLGYEKLQYMYLSNDSDHYSDGTAANLLG